jgi:predicted metal-dependent hydrolase
VTPLERGIRLFNDGDFFRCHEVLEEAWTVEHGPRRLFLQSLIHIAVAFYHRQRGNPAGASAQLRKGLGKLEAYLPSCEGIDTARLYHDAQTSLERTGDHQQGWEYPRIHLIA